MLVSRNEGELSVKDESHEERPSEGVEGVYAEKRRQTFSSTRCAGECVFEFLRFNNIFYGDFLLHLYFLSRFLINQEV